LDQYKYDLEEEQNKTNVLSTKISQILHERDQVINELTLLKQQQTIKEQNTRASTSSLQEMHGINAGLRRQLLDEQQRIVDARNETRHIQADVQHVYMELSTRDSELKMERDRNTALANKVDAHETVIIHLKEKIFKITDQLNKALGVRKTAIKRAEVTASKAKKMESEVAGTDRMMAEHELKIKNLQGQLAMKERRIVLMKKQHHAETMKHNNTKAERDILEQEVASLNTHLDRAEGALNERALQIVRDRKSGGEGGNGGPVLEGREDPKLRDNVPRSLVNRDSLELDNGFQKVSFQNAIRMGGGNHQQAKNKPQRVQFKRMAANAEPVVESQQKSKPKKKKMSRKENLRMIRQMTSQMPDAAKLPGSDAPSWMQDDDHDIM
jgi:chromosome segregation ATPase